MMWYTCKASTAVFGLVVCLVGSTIGQQESEEYLSPAALAIDPISQRLYIAAATGSRILVFNTDSQQIVDEWLVDAFPRALSLSPDGRKLYVTSAVPDGRLLVLDTRRGKIKQRIALGHTPVALAADPQGRFLYVCNQFDNTVSQVDTKKDKCVRTLPVIREPVAAAVTPDGDYVYVVNRLPVGVANASYMAAAVSVINVRKGAVEKTIELPDGSTNVQGIAISPDGNVAYATHVLARYQFPVTYLERGWVNTNALSVIDVSNQCYVNTVLLDDLDRGAADPYAVACTSDGRSVIVTHAGTHEISIIDRLNLHRILPKADSPRQFISAVMSSGDSLLTKDLPPAAKIPNNLGFLRGIRRRITIGGKGPRALVVAGTRIYVAEYYTDSLGCIDLAKSRARPVSLLLSDNQFLTAARRGEMFFHDASRSLQCWHSCATCHGAQARANAMNWDLLNDGIGNPKNTKSLYLSHATAPAMVTGVRPHMKSAIGAGIRYIQFVRPLRSQIDVMAAYLQQLKPIPSPYLEQGRLSESALKGERLFQKAGCAGCHSGSHYTDQQKHDVGTGTDEDNDSRYDVPSLVEAWRTAPYLHDGRAAQIRDVFTTFNPEDRHGRTSDLSEEELSQLETYVLTR